MVEGEDIPSLLKNKTILLMLLSDYDHGDKRKLLEQLLAFMDAHPIDLSGDPTSPTKAKFVQAGTDDE